MGGPWRVCGHVRRPVPVVGRKCYA